MNIQIHDTQYNSVCTFVSENNSKPYMVFIGKNTDVNLTYSQWAQESNFVEKIIYAQNRTLENQLF